MSTTTLRNFLVETPDAAGSTPNVPRPPVSAVGTSGLSSKANGLYRFHDQIIVACDDETMYRIADSSPLLAVPLTFTSDSASYLRGGKRPVFTEDPSDVFAAAGGRIVKWTPGTTNAAQITTSNAPVEVTHVAYLGQRLVANERATDAGKHRFYFAGLGDGSDTTWTALGFQTAEGRPDEVVALYENTSELFVFGASTIQVYGISEDPNAPFSPQNTVNIGLHANYSPVLIDDRFAMVDAERRIVLTDGRSVEIISDDIESWLRANTVSDAWGFRATFDKWDLLIYQFPTAKRTLTYNLKTKAWADWSRLDDGVVREMLFHAHAFRTSDKVHLFGSSTASDIDKLGTGIGQDYGTDPVLCERVTGVHRFGSRKRKRSRRVIPLMQRGVSGPSGTADSLEIRVRDDGGSWSDWIQVSTGNDGDTDQHAYVHHGGVFVGRQYHLRYAGTDTAAIVEVEDDVEELDS